jgi:choline-sulfatase
MGEKDSVRDSIVFAYDDVYLLSDEVPSSHIRCIRYKNWTYAVYFSLNGTGFQYELYDLQNDPGELNNLLFGREASKYYHIGNILHEKLTQKLRKEEGLPKGMPWPSQPFKSK